MPNDALSEDLLELVIEETLSKPARCLARFSNMKADNPGEIGYKYFGLDDFDFGVCHPGHHVFAAGRRGERILVSPGKKRRHREPGGPGGRGDVHRIRCAEIWGGIRDEDQDVCSAGIEASLFSSACAGASARHARSTV